MTKVTASQLLFSHVDSSESPLNRSGLQTLFSTLANVDPSERREIESRLFYTSNPNGDAKHVYFSTSSGQAVIASINPLEGTDRVGRRGLLFAHALIVPMKEFSSLGNNPFLLLRSFQFMRTKQEAFSIGETRTGNAPPVTIECILERESDSQRLEKLERVLHKDATRDLIRLAIHSARLIEQRSAVSFLGPPAGMYSILESLFDLLPSELRLRCSFDTMFGGANLARFRYWAIGIRQEDASRASTVRFDTKHGRFLHELHANQVDSFERWLRKALESRSLSDISQDVEHAYHLGQVLSGGPTNKILETASKQVTGAFLAINKEAVVASISEILNKQLGGALRDRILATVLEWFTSHSENAMCYLQDGFQQEQLCEWLLDSLADPSEAPSVEEMAGLSSFAKEASHLRLNLLLARWRRDWKDLELRLREADLESFSWFAAWVTQTPSFSGDWIVGVHEQGATISFRLGRTSEPDSSQDNQHLLATLARSTAAVRILRRPDLEGARRTRRGHRSPGQRRSEEAQEASSTSELASLADMDDIRWRIVLSGLKGSGGT